MMLMTVGDEIYTLEPSPGGSVMVLSGGKDADQHLDDEDIDRFIDFLASIGASELAEDIESYVHSWRSERWADKEGPLN